MHLRTALLIFTTLALSALNAAITVSTRFEPAKVAVGTPARYIVEIIETDNNTRPRAEAITSLPIPQSGGLTLRNGHTSSTQSTSIINGQSEYSSTQQLIIEAVSSATGSFTIPAYNFIYKGGHLQAPAATLTVVERTANDVPTVDELIFLKTDAPEQLYVGQTMPITLKLYVSSNVQLRGLNAFERSADGFTISDLPEQSNETIEMVNGRRYQVYSWPLTITPISAGPQDLNFQLTVSAQMPNQGRNNRSPFGGSIFDDFFGRSERFNIYTEPTKVDVRTLPQEGRPKSFSGAIGNFNMEVTTDTNATKVDEPIMLSLKLTGRGNFDRIKGPEMPQTRGWRNYKPEDVFEADASQPLKGVKRFDYVFIPETAGTLTLPEVNFSFFDPEDQKYIELSSPGLKVEVAPSNRPSIAAAPTTTDIENAATAINLTKTLNPEELLLTLDYRPSPGRSLEKNLLSSPLFYGLNIAGFLALTASGIWTYRSKRTRQSTDYVLIREAKLALKTAVSESQSNDAGIFYRSVQDAIRLASTIRIKRNLRSADFAELEAIFKQIQLPEATIEAARALFQAADNHRFSGRSQTADLQNARNQLNTILKAL